MTVLPYDEEFVLRLLAERDELWEAICEGVGRDTDVAAERNELEKRVDFLNDRLHSVAKARNEAVALVRRAQHNLRLEVEMGTTPEMPLLRTIDAFLARIDGESPGAQ